MRGGAEQWRQFAARLAVPIAYTDPEARVRFANSLFEKEFDLPTQSAIGQNLWDVVTVANTGKLNERVKKGDSFTFRVLAGNKSKGLTHGVLMSCVPNREADGTLVGCVIVVTDAYDHATPIQDGENRTAIGSDCAREMERRAIEAADTVRKQLGEDLHDNVGQQLTGLALMVDALAQLTSSFDPKVLALVEKVAEGVRQVQTDVRQLISGIIPAEIPADGLLPALDQLATQVRDQYGFDCALRTTTQAQFKDATTATHLFRIVQEAVSNALRHGKPSAITLAVRTDSDALVVEVKDNGSGFVHNPDGRGLGTRLMQDRAQRIGGAVTIAAGDSGTAVTVRVPTNSCSF